MGCEAIALLGVQPDVPSTPCTIYASCESKDTCLNLSYMLFTLCAGYSHAAVCMLPAEPPPGQLPSLAAAHLQAYAALIDCQLRVPVLPAYSMMLPAALLAHAVDALVVCSTAALLFSSI
jgi:hypothetical protein